MGSWDQVALNRGEECMSESPKTRTVGIANRAGCWRWLATPLVWEISCGFPASSRPKTAGWGVFDPVYRRLPGPGAATDVDRMDHGTLRAANKGIIPPPAIFDSMGRSKFLGNTFGVFGPVEQI